MKPRCFTAKVFITSTWGNYSLQHICLYWCKLLSKRLLFLGVKQTRICRYCAMGRHTSQCNANVGCLATLIAAGFCRWLNTTCILFYLRWRCISRSIFFYALIGDFLLWELLHSSCPEWVQFYQPFLYCDFICIDCYQLKCSYGNSVRDYICVCLYKCVVVCWLGKCSFSVLLTRF